MDVPPDRENPGRFIAITAHLRDLGIRVPALCEHDLSHGFLILEDLGDDTFTRLLDLGHDPDKLYRKAANVIAQLQNHHNAKNVAVGEYDIDTTVQEVLLFTDWYLPCVRGIAHARKHRPAFIAAWRRIFSRLPRMPTTLVLRDFHVDNLMRVTGECAVLDYQDALTGSPAYDLVCLCEDARRDVAENTRRAALEQYFAHRPHIDRQSFHCHFAFWAAQRHCKVIGIFTRLWLRDNKDVYLQHLPRVFAQLQRALHHPGMEEVRRWFNGNDMPMEFRAFTASRESYLSRAPRTTDEQ